MGRRQSFDQDFFLQDDQEALRVRYSDIKAFFKANWNDEEIRKIYPHLRPKALLRARAYFHVEDLSKSAKKKLRRVFNGQVALRILCDENTSMHMVRLCQLFASNATHVYFEGLAGASDQQVWAYAAKHKFDVVLSYDRRRISDTDLTNIAKAAWADRGSKHALPVLLHIHRDLRHLGEFEAVLRSHLPQVKEQVKAGEHYSLLLHHNGLTPNAELERIQHVKLPKTRAEAWARQFTQKALKQRHVPGWPDKAVPGVKAIHHKVRKAVAIACMRNNEQIAAHAARISLCLGASLSAEFKMAYITFLCDEINNLGGRTALKQLIQRIGQRDVEVAQAPGLVRC